MLLTQFLVACHACRRQFNVTRRAPGSQFRCKCRTVLTVPESQARDMPVVRCESCGSPRAADEAPCAFCGAALAPVAADQALLCPGCLTRNSAHAFYCHSCGLAIVVDTHLGDRSSLECPVCPDGEHLLSRALGDGGAAMLECGGCTGVFISHPVLDAAARKASAEPKGAYLEPCSDPKVQAARGLAQSGPFYRKCPECGSMMARTNYARRSGIIVDICRDHGVWFDARELEAVLQWLRGGGAPHRAGTTSGRRESEMELPGRSRESSGQALGRTGGGAPEQDGTFFLEEAVDALFAFWF